MFRSAWTGTEIVKAILKTKRCRHLRCYSISSGPASSPTLLVRPFGNPDPDILQSDFTLLPHFYTAAETRQLLAAALWKLDRGDSTRRRRSGPSHPQAQLPHTSSANSPPLADLFHGQYGFEPGHYDAVIHQYRESLMSTLPTPSSSSYPDLITLLHKAYALLLPDSTSIANGTPPSNVITHLLHLSPEGQIKGHVDNLEASGGVISGICLGADRILRLSKGEAGSSEKGWDVLLQNGTVYLQRGRLRYEYEHSILPYDSTDSNWDGRPLVPGHRVSVMIRDAPKA
ncbi:hypothetical protein BD324DRAFT_636673 [Kockovaella imperatae]|uniref:Alpha-ketoglutarate-dependent dioxygenase AlkB-like domain-containing protein n=1 Tax=Kockovaella imperatae TaxID=4999 RepID=A0A1Y1UAK9_9TREE|nr:hypothetical protein BD324DRAFT_636673 [Kockovaella imperatae]ORX34115.1 hypothetical protein BD324DRAFT_636673 [Kockovaella imperatae]